MDERLSFESFLAGARKFAELAMAAHVRPDHEQFALHAGVAVERLTKAVLARKNLALLLDMRTGVEMLFHLTGVMDAQKVRTISMTEAISRLRQLDVLPRGDAELDLLVALRNGVAHSEGSLAREDLMPVFVRTADSLLDHVGEDRDAFWGDWRQTAAMAADRAGPALERDVHLRIQNARYLFNAGISQPSDEFMANHLYSASERRHIKVEWSESATLTEKIECPACGGGPETKMTISDLFDEDRNIVIAEAFACPFCHLSLNSAEELELAGISSTFDADECEDAKLAYWVKLFISGERKVRRDALDHLRGEMPRPFSGSPESD